MHGRQKASQQPNKKYTQYTNFVLSQTLPQLLLAGYPNWLYTYMIESSLSCSHRLHSVESGSSKGRWLGLLAWLGKGMVEENTPSQPLKSIRCRTRESGQRDTYWECNGMVELVKRSGSISINNVYQQWCVRRYERVRRSGSKHGSALKAPHHCQGI